MVAALGLAASLSAQAGSACADLAGWAGIGADGPVLLVSYPTAPPGPLGQAAFVYDNAVAAIALVGCGAAGPAHHIGDALLLALHDDRYWHDGRLRNAYAAGPVAAPALNLAGWWDRTSGRWLEDGYQVGTDSGNMAWAMLALLSLDAADADHAAAGPRPYLQGALELASWLDTERDHRGAGGFLGGTLGDEPSPLLQRWKSTEHNVDLAAAFARLAVASGDAHWRARAQAASGLVAAMWDARCGCFATGTLEDGLTINPLRALDAQVWPLLALPEGMARYAGALTYAERELRSGPGYAYSQVGGGVWIEGTAQVLLLLERLHRDSEAAPLRIVIESARASGGGYYATAGGSVPTGFALATDPDQQRLYPHLPHLAATAWAALAEQGVNPFTAGRTLPR